MAVGAPGYLFLREEERRAPRRLARSALEDTIQFFVVGALISIAAIVVVLAIGLWPRAGLIELNEIAHGGADTYVHAHVERSLASASAALVLTVLIARLSPALLYRKNKPTYEPGRSVWDKILGESSRGHYVWASIELSDGRSVEGYISAYSTDMVGDGREIALCSPLFLIEVDDRGVARRTRLVTSNRIIVKSSDMRRISCRLEQPVMGGPPSPLQ